MNKELILELLNDPLPYTHEEEIGYDENGEETEEINRHEYKFKLGSRPMIVGIFSSVDGNSSYRGRNDYEIEFGKTGMYGEIDLDLKSKIRASEQILQLWATIKDIVINFVKKYNPNRLVFNSWNDDKRLDLFYKSIAPKLAKEIDYTYSRNGSYNVLTRKKTNVA